MPQFAYSAINAEGAELTGEIQATDVSAARVALSGNGLLAQWISELTGQSTERKSQVPSPRRSSRSRSRCSHASSRR